MLKSQHISTIIQSKFKDANTFDMRLTESSRVLERYPDRIPIICEKIQQIDLPDVDRHKYLAPHYLPIGEFAQVIKHRIKLRPEEALCIFINGKIMAYNNTLGSIYANEKDADGFLYMRYGKENVFGTD